MAPCECTNETKLLWFIFKVAHVANYREKDWCVFVFVVHGHCIQGHWIASISRLDRPRIRLKCVLIRFSWALPFFFFSICDVRSNSAWIRYASCFVWTLLCQYRNGDDLGVRQIKNNMQNTSSAICKLYVKINLERNISWS